MNDPEKLISIFEQSADLLVGVAMHDTSNLSEKMTSIYKDTFNIFFDSKVKESLSLMNGTHYINKLYGNITGKLPRIDESFIDHDYLWREDTIDLNYLDTLRYVFHTKSLDELVYKQGTEDDGYTVTIRLLETGALVFVYGNHAHGELYKWGYSQHNEPCPVYSAIYTDNEPLYFIPSFDKQHEIIKAIVLEQTGYEIDHDITDLYAKVSKVAEETVVKNDKSNLPVQLLETDHIRVDIVEENGKLELSMLSNKAYRFNYCILKQVLEELELLNNQSEDKQPQSNTDANDNAGDELTTPCNHVE